MPGWLILILGMAAVPAVTFVLAKFLPDQTIYDFMFNIGKKVDVAVSKYIGDGNWEAIEDTLVQKFVVAAQGLKDGADVDDGAVVE